MKRAGLVLASVIIVMTATICFRAIMNGRAIERRLEVLRTTGHPTSFVELADHERLPGDVENAAAIYKKAFAAYGRPAEDKEIPVQGSAGLLDRGEPLPEAMLVEIREYLLENQECLKLLREAGEMERCCYERDNKGQTGHFWNMRSCIQLLSLAVLYSGYNGDRDGSIAYVNDMLRLAGSVPDEPDLIGHILRTACIGMALRAIEQWFNVAPFAEEELQKVDQMCSGAAASLDVEEALDIERCFVVEHWANPDLIAGAGGRIFNHLPGMTKQVLCDLLDYVDDCIEAARLPESERLARMDEIDRQLQGLSFLHAISKIVAPSAHRVVELDLYCHADLKMTQTAIAVERYRLAEGGVPERLRDLVPQYLDAVPIDPFDGRPIRYRRTQSGYLLYSISEDGQDNGGLTRDEVNKGEPYDLCFTVVR